MACRPSSKDALENINDIDVVFHMGARAGVRQSFKDPLSYIKDNTVGQLMLQIIVEKTPFQK